MSNLTEEEQKYIEENKKQLQVAVDNCYILFDPQQKQKPEDMFKFIEQNESDKVYIYMFIVNTCELVSKDVIIDGQVLEGRKLEPIHIITVSEFYKQMTEEHIKYYSQLIKDSFFAPVDIVKSGLIQFIWIQLLDGCMQKIQRAREPEEDNEDAKSNVTEISQISDNPETEQGITQQPEFQPIGL